jgi:hypothetical protein
MVLSYLIGDNLFFRIATYIFIGVAAGYAGSIAWHNVIKPVLLEPLLSGGLAEVFRPTSIVTLIVPWLLVLLLLLKLSPKSSRYGGLPVALLVGVGAAVIVGGGITGTLIPQSLAATETLDPIAASPLTGELGIERMLNIGIMLLGTISTLSYFRFTTRQDPSGVTRRFRFSNVIATVGQLFIAVTFGVMYAGALTATIIILSERIQFLRGVITLIMGVVTDV